MKLYRLVPVALAIAFGLSACGGGANSSSLTPTSSSPVSVTAAIQVDNGITQDPKTGSLEGVVGTKITLDGTKSTSSNGPIQTYRWSVDKRPAGSKANPDSADSATTDFTPDVNGAYTVTLQATDANGHVGIIHTPIIIMRHPVTLSVNVGVVFTTTPTKVTQDIQVGSYITLDASNSTTSAGTTLKFAWSLKSEPAGSAAALSSATNPIVDLTADVAGTYDILVTATNNLGVKSSAEYIFIANPGPSAIVIAGIASSGGLSGSLKAATGYLVMLNGASSVVQPGDTVSYNWNLVQKPSGSTVSLANLSGPNTNFVPDVVGQYIVTLDFADTTEGLASTYTMTINASRGPVAIISASGSPVAVATVPAFVSSPGTTVTLLGDGSYELDGDPLTYAWSITAKPAGSAASIANATSVDASITPDLNGSYGIKLVVTDTTTGDAAVSTASIQVGGYLPVAVISKPQVSLLLGGTVTDTAASSYDPQALPLTFDWQILAAPAGSTATITGSSTTSSVSFTPDVAGTYTLTVTVSNGTLSADGVLTITAFAPTAGTVPIFYQPLMEKYSRATDRLALISANPNMLHIVDLGTGTDTAVALPASVVAMALSPDGTKAAVLHSAVVDVVDLNAGTLLHSWPTSGAQTMVVISNSGLIYVAGQSSGCCNESMQILNASTGATVQNFTSYPALYQATAGVLADATNQIFVSSGAVNVYSLSLNAATGQLVSSGAQTSGTYSLQCGPLWLSSDQSLLFTCNGDFFSTSGLGYAGTLGLGSNMLSVSDDTSISETVVLTKVQNPNFTYVYPGVYNLFTGNLLFPQGTIPLPLIAGIQSYGIAMFHSSGDRHVMVVQTGSNQPNAAGVQYFAILR
jgi:hypothetical protein